MADVQLNKPLYKSGDKDANFVPPTPRQPRPSILGRGAALFLDIVLLSLVFTAVVHYVPGIPLALGPVAPWFGLALGWCYFGIGFSHITLGRTLGKLIIRVQVCELAGPDLPVGRAFARAALLLWPLPVRLALTMVAESASARDPLSSLEAVDFFGTMLAIGWVLGNAGFAAMSVSKRTLYDRLTGSIVVNAELENEPVQAFLGAAREEAVRPPSRGSMLYLGGAMTLCAAYAIASFTALVKARQDITPEIREKAGMMVYEGFGKVRPGVRRPEITTDTMPMISEFRSRTPIDVAALKADSKTTAILQHLENEVTGPNHIEYVSAYLESVNMMRGRSGEGPVPPPSKAYLEISFSEYPDMFFARESQPVYTLSKTVDLPTSGTAATDSPTTATTSADTATTETVHSDTTTTTP